MLSGKIDRLREKTAELHNLRRKHWQLFGLEPEPAPKGVVIGNDQTEQRIPHSLGVDIGTFNKPDDAERRERQRLRSEEWPQPVNA